MEGAKYGEHSLSSLYLISSLIIAVVMFSRVLGVTAVIADGLKERKLKI